MDKISIIQQGEMAKYKIIVTDPEYDLDTCDFTIELSWGLFGKKILIRKSDCLKSKESWFFTFDSKEMIGFVTARCTWYVPDTDLPDNLRTEVDAQYLCFVSSTPCTSLLCNRCDEGDHRVQYERTEQSDMSAYCLLLTKDDELLLTINDEQLQVLIENV